MAHESPPTPRENDEIDDFYNVQKLKISKALTCFVMINDHVDVSITRVFSN